MMLETALHLQSAGYVNDASNMVGVRDLMIVCDTSTPTTNFVTVLSNTGSFIDLSDRTGEAETDSD